MIAGGVTSMDYEIRHIAEAGGAVLVERTETWHFPSGERPTLRVMCTIELDDDKIVAWREYWNGEELMSEMPPEFFEGVERALAQDAQPRESSGLLIPARRLCRQWPPASARGSQVGSAATRTATASTKTPTARTRRSPPGAVFS